ncbi:MAG: energy transducer TonB [Bacteroidetes bacterium]|nr:energy transducer TonB [Bacteroidota bacterium]
MKKTIFFFFCFCCYIGIQAQQLQNIVLVSDDGITSDINKAKYFIAIKKNRAGKYERLDYKLYGPLIEVRTFSDSLLEIQDGKHLEYDDKGKLTVMGNYVANKKEGDWYYYNDTFKVIRNEEYANDVLVNVIDNPAKETDTTYGDEKEAGYKGGENNWQRFLVNNLDMEAGINSKAGGTVLVAFSITVTGELDDCFLRKSVEWVLDEEALRVIGKTPAWEPAFQHGKNVKAYRVQPITFLKQE